MAIPFAVPYAPNSVPTVQLGGEPTQQLQDLTRFLHEELDRIGEAMRFVPVQAAYGALNVNPGPVSNPLDILPPQLILGWNNFSPDQPNRVAASTLGNSLIPEEGGVGLIQVQITATVETNTTYTISVAVNGVVSTIFSTSDAGNQSTFLTIGFYGLVELDAGDLVTVVGAAIGQGQGPWQFDMESATFSLVRVSELHGRNAASVP